MELIRRFAPIRLDLSAEVEDLAAEYHHHGVIPRSMPEDALHIACATVAELDALVSWNMRHIANLRRQERVQAVNLMNGYHKPISLITPMEVMIYE